MKKRLKPIGLALLALLITQEIWAIRVTPTYQIFRAKAGSKLTGELIITNSDEADITVIPSVVGFFTLPENKDIKTTDWLKINSSEIDIKKGESQKFNFTVSIPKKAKGELAGNLNFVTKNTKVGGIAMSLTLAIYALVDGTEKPKVEIPAFAVQVDSSTTIGLNVMNTGNVHVRPTGFIYVNDEKNQRVLNVGIERGMPALPHQPRTYSGVVKNFRLPEGHYRMDVALEDADWGFPIPSVKRKFVVKKDGTVAVD